jgi:hypothetical protein
MHDDEPRDQDRDLGIPHLYGEVGPDSRHGPGGWSWTIVRSPDGEEIDGGFADDEAAAKRAVDEWERANAEAS